MEAAPETAAKPPGRSARPGRRKAGTNGAPPRAAADGAVVLDLGTTYLKVARIDADGALVAAAAHRHDLAYPPDFEGQQTSWAEAIRQVCAEAGIPPGASLTLALPRGAVTVKTLLLPPADDRQTERLLAFEAAQHVPFPPEEAVLAFRRLPDEPAPADDGEEERLAPILLVAARRALVESAIAAVVAAGYGALGVGVTTLGAAEVGAGAGAGPLLVADVGGRATEIAVAEDGQLVFSRAVPVGLEQLIEGVARSRELPLEAAERLARERGIAALLEDGAREWVARLSGELRRSIIAFESDRVAASPITRIALVGGGARVAGLSGALFDEIGLPIEPTDDTGEAGPELAAAVGLAALVRRSDGLGTLDLTPRVSEEETEGRKAEVRKRGLALVAGFLAVAVAVAGAIFYQGSLQETSRRERATRVLRQAETEHRAAEAEYRQLAARVATAESVLPWRRSAVDVVAAVSAATPPQVFLTQMTFERNGLLSLRGTSDSEDRVADLILALSRLPMLTEVRLNFVGSQQRGPAEAETAPRIGFLVTARLRDEQAAGGGQP